MKIIANNGTMRIEALDQHERLAEYYLRINNIKKLILTKEMSYGRKIINLSSYGEIIYSAYIEKSRGE